MERLEDLVSRFVAEGMVETAGGDLVMSFAEVIAGTVPGLHVVSSPYATAVLLRIWFSFNASDEAISCPSR